MSATAFHELGLDPLTVRADLSKLGINHSIYTDQQLESLALVSNIVMLSAISGKSTEIQELLGRYEAAVDKLSAMQQILSNVNTLIATDEATGKTVMDFIETETTFIDFDDTSTIGIDYSVSDGLSSGTLANYSTLGDYIAALENNDSVGATGTSGDSILAAEYTRLILEGRVTGIYSSTGIEKSAFPDGGGPDDVIDVLLNGGYVGYHSAIGYEGTPAQGGGNYTEQNIVYITLDEFKQYLIANAMQEAGYIGAGVYIEPIIFASGSQPELALHNDYWVLQHQYYFGKVSVDFDATAGSVKVDYNSMAATKEMGIEFEEYFEVDGNGMYMWNTHPFHAPSADGTATAIFNMCFYYALEMDPDNSPGDAGHGSNDWHTFYATASASDIISTNDVDTLQESMATAIEGQSTSTESSLLRVNSGITQWGELNDVWDMIHEYVHDALKRASDNSA